MQILSVVHHFQSEPDGYKVNKKYACATDNFVKVWDIQSEQIIQTVFMLERFWYYRCSLSCKYLESFVKSLK